MQNNNKCRRFCQDVTRYQGPETRRETTTQNERQQITNDDIITHNQEEQNKFKFYFWTHLCPFD